MLNYSEMSNDMLRMTYETTAGQLEGAQRVLQAARIEVQQMELDMMNIVGEMMRRVDESGDE